MARSTPNSLVLGLVLGVASLAVLACGPRQPEIQAKPRKLDAAEREANAIAQSPDKPPAWQRKPASMPETFAAFPRPDLSKLDGIWIVDGEIPGERVAWIIEDEGSKLTTVDRRGRERIQGLTLTSPCALRLTDSYGRSHSRSISLRDDQLLITTKGAIAITAADGSLLVCAGHRTYQIAADGRCRHTTEMLGVWSELAEPSETCKLATGDDGGRVLTIGAQELHERSGVWLDEVAAGSAAERVETRGAAFEAITPAVEAETGTETGAGEELAR